MTLETVERDYAAFLASDMLAQFQDKPNTTALLNALARQLDDYMRVCKQLIALRTIENAVGVQLDGIGDIVKLTRKQAGMLYGGIVTEYDKLPDEVLAEIEAGTIKNPSDMLQSHAQYGLIPIDILDDETYRQYLRYKIFLNTSTCTYADVMKTVSLYWKSSELSYSEMVKNRNDGTIYPATMKLNAGEFTDLRAARLFFLSPVIKAAGVSVVREATTTARQTEKTMRHAGAICGGIMETNLPFHERTA